MVKGDQSILPCFRSVTFAGDEAPAGGITSELTSGVVSPGVCMCVVRRITPFDLLCVLSGCLFLVFRYFFISLWKIKNWISKR
jgi:hypothetical protein